MAVIHSSEYQKTVEFHPPIETGKDIYYGVELEVELASAMDEDVDTEDIVDACSDPERSECYPFAELICTAEDVCGDDFFYCKTDGSLKCGLEICSEPATLEYHMTKWDAVCAKLSMGGFISDTRTCGMHVHVDRRSLHQMDLIKLALIVYAKQYKWFFEAIGQRKWNEFCGGAVPEKKKVDDWGSLKTRYVALNFRPQLTIEFRFFQGTLFPDSIKARIEFIELLIKFCKSTNICKIVSDNALSIFRSYLEKNASKNLITYVENCLKVVNYVD